MSIQVKSAAITGAGSGLGREIALGLAAKGYTVFGTAFSAEEIAEFEKTAGTADITLTVCDITKEEEVKKWGDVVIIATRGEGLDLLINNAGVLTPGPMEVLAIDAIRREFEVNVFGSISVINTFLPSLRRSKGRILQIGSMTGRFPLPFSGPSSASKATMEAFADVYRTELRPFGVDFVMVQPGNMVTGGPAKTAAQLRQISDTMTAEQKRLYGEYFEQFSTALNRMQSAGLSAKDAAARVIEISEQAPAPIRAAVGKDAEDILKMVREKSDKELDLFRTQLFGLDKLQKDTKPTIIANDATSYKNVETVMALYDEMINRNQPAAAVQKYLRPDYIQHNPLIPTSAKSLGDFFGHVITAHKNLHVVVHQVVASGDYVFAHVNFVNLYSDDPNDRGIAGVDMYRFDANGKIAEHWDVLQEVPDPGKSANANGMF